MGWAQILPAIIGLLGGSLLGGGGSTPATPTASQTEMQDLMATLLRGQVGEYNYGAPLRQHITQAADWLLPRKDMMHGQSPEYDVGPIRNGDGPNNTIHPGPSHDTPVPEPDPLKPNPGGPTEPLDQSAASQTSPAPPTAPSASGVDFLAKYLTKFAGARG